MVIVSHCRRVKFALEYLHSFSWLIRSYGCTHLYLYLLSIPISTTKTGYCRHSFTIHSTLTLSQCLLHDVKHRNFLFESPLKHESAAIKHKFMFSSKNKQHSFCHYCLASSHYMRQWLRSYDPCNVFRQLHYWWHHNKDHFNISLSKDIFF